MLMCDMNDGDDDGYTQSIGHIVTIYIMHYRRSSRQTQNWMKFKAIFYHGCII